MCDVTLCSSVESCLQIVTFLYWRWREQVLQNVDVHVHDVPADMYVHVRCYTSDSGHSGADRDAVCEDLD